MPSRLTHSVLFACLLSLPLLNGCKKEQQRAEPVSQEEIQKKQDKIIADLKQKYPPKETESSAPPAAVPIEESREAAAHSGGLGLDMAALEMHHGKIVEYTAADGGMEPGFEHNEKATLFAVSNSRYAINIAVKEIPSTIDNMADVHSYVQRYIPTDSQLLHVQSYEFSGADISKIYNHPVETYYSSWLASRLSPEEWRRYGPPGQFYIDYMNRIADIQVGNYPPH